MTLKERQRKAKTAISQLNNLVRRLRNKRGYTGKHIEQSLCTYCQYHWFETPHMGEGDYDSGCDMHARTYERDSFGVMRCGYFRPKPDTELRIANFKVSLLEHYLEDQDRIRPWSNYHVALQKIRSEHYRLSDDERTPVDILRNVMNIAEAALSTDVVNSRSVQVPLDAWSHTYWERPVLEPQGV